MTIIAAITRDLALGRAGDMIYHISADLRRFKQITMGHPLVMGRRTFESFPNGPLPGRRNAVVTRDAAYVPAGVEVSRQPSAPSEVGSPRIEVYPTLEDAIKAVGDDAMVVGGGQVYAQAMPLADTLEITEIDATAPDADTHFPDIDPTRWRLTAATDWQTDPRTAVSFRYLTYARR